MSYRYKDAERAVFAALPVAPNAVGAARGKFQHLRRHGCPSNARPGTGTAALYTVANVYEMGLALEMERVGLPPRSAARAALSVVGLNIAALAADEQVFIALDPTQRDPFTVLAGWKVYLRWLRKDAPKAFAIINLSAIVKALDQALAETGTPDARQEE